MGSEQVLQKLPRRCPYCNKVLPDKDLPEEGETGEVCPHCGKIFIRVKTSWDKPGDRSGG